MKAEISIANMHGSQKMPRKIRKVLVERKRRERIDGCLKQIKDILFKGTEYQNENAKIEKADILENVLEFIKCKSSTAKQSPEKSKAEYRLGYISCMKEISQVLEPMCGQTPVSLSLMQYMNNKLNNMVLISPTSCKSNDRKYRQNPPLNHHTFGYPCRTSTPIIDTQRNEQFTKRSLNFNDSFYHTKPTGQYYFYNSVENRNSNINVCDTRVSSSEVLSVVPDSTSSIVKVEPLSPIPVVKQETNELSSNVWRPW